MNPLSIIKYIVEHLQGTSYEPWVNALLFMLLVVVFVVTCVLVIGRNGRKLMKKVGSAATDKFSKRKGFAPEWEAFRVRVEPYVTFYGSLYLAFVGLYSAILVGLAFSLGSRNAPWWGSVIALVWVALSFIYMRISLEDASWAYHTIKNRKLRDPAH